MHQNLNDCARLLQDGLMQLGIDVSAEQQTKLLDYVLLLAKWSKAYNLTTVREPDQIVATHILDSLSILPQVQSATSILDVGTGAGLPGIPLSILLPQTMFQLIDSQQKKITFVQHVITSLKLTNVQASAHRVETWQPARSVDLIVSRAFASLAEFVKLIEKHCAPGTQVLAMKGRQAVVEQELSELPNNFELLNIQILQVPGLDGERCVVKLRKKEV